MRLLKTPDSGVQPQAVTDVNGTLHLVFLKGEPAACDVFYTTRKAGQTNFAKPIQVNSRPGSAVAMGTIRGAQLALGRNGRVHVAWNGSSKVKKPNAESVPMLYARLNDGGTAFESERNLMTSTDALDGGGSVAADDKGNVFVVWHAHKIGSPSGEANRAVFLAKSTDDGKTFAPEKMISKGSSGACGCCGLKAFADSRGNLGVLYRAATGGSARDVTLLTSRDAGETFASLIVGAWQAKTCPMSSMSLAQGNGDTWRAAWETGSKIEVGTTAPPFGFGMATEPGGRGAKKYPVVAVNAQGKGGRQLVAWVTGTSWGKGGSFEWEITDFETGKTTTGSGGSVSAWSFVTAVAEKDGGFTIVY